MPRSAPAESPSSRPLEGGRARLRDLLRRVRTALPEGRALPEDIWQRRHRGIRSLLWAHVGAIVVFALARGYGPVHSLFEASIVAAFAVAAGVTTSFRRAPAVLATLGLLSCSGIFVHLSGGVIEMHFHYFVILGVIALYQDWLTYLLAVGFVAVQHGVMGVIESTMVFNHPGAWHRPWLWAGIHAAFVLAASVVSMVAWRMNETYRAQADRAHQQAAVAELSRIALTGASIRSLAQEAVRLLAETLDSEFAAVFEYASHPSVLQVYAAVGWDAEQFDSAMIAVPGAVDPAPSVHPVAASAGACGQECLPQGFLQDQGICSGAGVVIVGPEAPFGTLGVHSRRVRTYDAHDLSLLESFANILGVALRQKQVEAQLLHQAFHDPLTGLANRALFTDRLQNALRRAQRSGRHVAVSLLDLDNFKAVNDSLGHAAGDELLVAVAGRLAGCVRPGDTVARLGGDEFAILLEETRELEALGSTDRVLDTLRQPLVLGGRPILVEASVGIALSVEACEPSLLLRNADLAMYAAKSAGKARSEVYRTGMHEAIVVRLALEADLRRSLEHALAGGEFHLLYQPKVSLETSRLVGVEALLRWQHPQRGVVGPVDFIPLAEETGLIVPIGTWVIEQACRQSAAWHASAPDQPYPVVSVNVSGRQFDAQLVETVRAALAAADLPAAALCIEVTESVIITDVEGAITRLRELKALGVKISVDDFGTGYSSLNYLKKFPLDELKIDKSFVDGLGLEAEDDAIVAAILGMAHALDLTVVAEGVETQGQVAGLRMLGCESAQGFYFARPRPAEVIAGLIAGGGSMGPAAAAAGCGGEARRGAPAPRQPVRQRDGLASRGT